MNFRELNEKMQAFLEISAETRQRVVDARREQAQKAMDKYAKTKSLADRHAKLDFSKPVKVVTEIDTVTNVSELIPEDKIENEIFEMQKIIEKSNVNITISDKLSIESKKNNNAF